MKQLSTATLETGMDETDTTSFISSMNVLALQRLKKANYSKLTGGLIMMCGVAITFFLFSIHLKG